MFFSSHRGNLQGAEPHRENTERQIVRCINLGFDVEIDLWYLNNTYWLDMMKHLIKHPETFCLDIKKNFGVMLKIIKHFLIYSKITYTVSGMMMILIH